MRLVFDKPGTFESMWAAEAWCRRHGISAGSSCVSGPQGLLRGDFCISKWHNMTRAEQKALDGTLQAGREGPAVIVLKDLDLPPLFVPLKTEFFTAFESGSKDTEYRPYGPRWNEKTCPVGRLVTLSHGYGTKRRLRGVVVDFERSMDPSKTEAWRKCYGELEREVACIWIALYGAQQ